uniref:Tudor domain-containing protein 6 isoform X2 n=1 Tax=Geotrypetes seraphini TaxID=260995 RepID=A0A6P8QHP9_GEOSA|nr:tudor domain-containing protein 6 isoform X2 [Geotrypetes seraphini]
MSCAPCLPPPGSSVSLRVSYVDARPDVILVRLWGAPPYKLLAYRHLHSDIQDYATGSESSRFYAPCPGDCCLVQVNAQWLRGRVISRQSFEFRILLLDEGRPVVTRAEGLLPGRREFFQLPGEVVPCVLANLVPPLSGGELSSWSPRALEVLGSLRGSDVQGVVREVVAPQRLLVLDTIAFTACMQEEGLAQRIPDATFRAILHRCLSPLTSHPLHSLPPFPQPAMQTKGDKATSRRALPAMASHLDYFYPQLQPGVMEPVTVTHVADPQRVFCQLRSLVQEIQRLSDSMHHVYESRAEEAEKLELLGQPCAARSADGRWYRALLQELLPEKRLALVLLVDYGRKELVAREGLHHLQPEYFRMPVVTYCCALFGIADWGNGWSPAQVDELRSLTLGKSVSAKIEYYSSYEHVYFVTLWREDSVNINCLYGVQARCLTSEAVTSRRSEGRGEPSPPVPPLPLEGVQLALHSFHDAVVEFVTDPSEFWVRTKEYAAPYRSMMEAIAAFYSRAPKLEGIIRKPKPGLLCCAKFKDNCFYRAVVVAVHDKLVDVYFLDSGNTETVDWYDVKELLPQFKELPAVAVKCCLVDVSPLRDSWSVETIDYFKKILVDKELVIYVLSKHGDTYAIEVLDESRTREKNVSKIICLAGHAKYQEFEVVSAEKKVPLQVSAHVSQEINQVNSEKEQLGRGDQRVEKDKLLNLLKRYDLKDSFPAPNLQNDSAKEAKDANNNLEASSDLVQSSLDLSEVAEYVGYNFEVGSTEAVQVSYVETPGMFWCQLIRSANELKWLMQKIQDYCKNMVCPYKYNRLVCLAKYSEDGKWYRALITSRMPNGGASSIEHVEVRYVDYGNKETVSVKDLCLIHKDFLQLNAQAFRCSLYNLVEPCGNDPLDWDEETVLAFQDFVDGALTNHKELSCTVFAVTTANNIQINVVDLFTPFESICHVLTEKGLAQPVQLEKPLVPFLQLSSYYYSMHDIKIGSEEDVFVTYADHPCSFYCQLERNSDTLEQLKHEITQLCAASQYLKSSLNTNILCLAKYTDKQWYRGIIKCAKFNKVFFVDFGKIGNIKEDDLRLIPKDAHKILRLPMQAIKCGLSDIPLNIPEEVKKWFEKAVMAKRLKAIVVAKESDGRLVVELYDGNIQINAKLKENMGLRCHRESNKPISDTCVLSRNTKVRDEKRTAACISKDLESKICRSDNGGVCNAKIGTLYKVKASQNSESKNISKHQFVEGKRGDDGGNKVSNFGSQNVVSNSPFVQKDYKTVGFNKKETQDEHLSLKKVVDLPQKRIVPGFKTRVYVAHINNLSDFFVQFVEDETQLDTISEGLNDKISESLHVKDLQLGDLVCALFPDDELWYRAVVKEKQTHGLHVQYIDYGNSAVIDESKICRLVQDFSSFPAMSIHCSLDGLQTLSTANQIQEAILHFTERTSDIQIDCEFKQLHGDTWEVILSDQQGLITEDLHVSLGTKLDSQLSEKPELINHGTTEEGLGEIDFSENAKKDGVLTNSKQFNWMIPARGQTVTCYVTAVDSPEYFWCQFSDSKDIDSLTQKMQETGTFEITNTDSVLNIQVGDACMVKYSEDEQWYRALVEKIEEDYASVRFVDYGNEENTSKDVIKLIPNEFLTIKVQAFPCCLFGFSSLKGSWTSDGNKVFYELSTEDMVQVTVVDTECYQKAWRIPLSLVTLECKGRNINTEMKQFWQLHINNSALDRQNTITENIDVTDNIAPVTIEVCSSVTLELSKEVVELTQNQKNGMEQTASLGADKDLLAPKQCLDIVPYKSPFLAIETAAIEMYSVNEFEGGETNVHKDEKNMENSVIEKEDTDKETKWFAGFDTHPLASDAQPLYTESGSTLPPCEVIAEQCSLHFDETCEEELIQQVACEEMQADQDMYEEVFKNSSTKTTNELFSNVLVSDEEEMDEVETDIDTLPSLKTDTAGTTFTLAGFTVGSKCVIRLPEEDGWSVAEILSISEEGTRVLIPSNGKEVTVDPMDVWNTLPESTEIAAQAVSRSCFYSQPSTESSEMLEPGFCDSSAVDLYRLILCSSEAQPEEAASSDSSKSSSDHENNFCSLGKEDSSTQSYNKQEAASNDSSNASSDHENNFCSLGKEDSSTQSYNKQEAASSDSSNASSDHENNFCSLGKEDSSIQSYNKQEPGTNESSVAAISYQIPSVNLVEVLVKEISHSHEIFEQEMTLDHTSETNLDFLASSISENTLGKEISSCQAESEPSSEKEMQSEHEGEFDFVEERTFKSEL